MKHFLNVLWFHRRVLTLIFVPILGLVFINLILKWLSMRTGLPYEFVLLGVLAVIVWSFFENFN